MTVARPWRATVYLPGHLEDGRLVVWRRLAYATEEARDARMAGWEEEGFVVQRYEVLELDLDI